jgi:hypothetical protein
MKAALGTEKHHVDCLNLDILITSRAAYGSRPNIKAKPQRLLFTYIIYATTSSAVQVCRGPDLHVLLREADWPVSRPSIASMSHNSYRGHRY